jgi:hypothetical protein
MDLKKRKSDEGDEVRDDEVAEVFWQSQKRK